MGKITNAISNTFKYFVGERGGQAFSSWVNAWLSKRSRKQLLEEYKNLVYQCVSAIAEDVGQYTPQLFRKDNRNNKETPVSSHPFLTLLENPSDDMSQYELFEATQSFIELTGEAFWYLELGEITRTPKSIGLMRPDRMEVAIDDKTGKVVGYSIRRDDGSKIPLETDEVIHFKMFNPMNPYRGLGTVQANLLYIDTENNTSEFQNNFMKNQATPSGVLTFNGNISKEAFDKLKKQWKRQQSGVKNAGKTLLIRKVDADFKQIGLSLADINLSDLKKLTDEKVREAFRVPKALLGETDSSGLGRGNVEAIEYVFAKRVIDPKLNRIDDTLRMAMKRYYKKENLVLKHESQIPADKQFEQTEYEKGVRKWYTVNEVRAFKGLDPVQGGDKIYTPFNEIPIDEESASTESSKAKKSYGKIIIKKKLIRSSAEDNYYELLNKNEERTERRYRAAIRKLANDQRDKIIELLKAQSEKGFTKKAYEELMPNESEEAKKFADLLVPFLIACMEVSGPAALEFLAVDNLDFVVSQAMRNAVFDSTERLLRSFTRQTVQKLQKQLAQGLAANETVEQLAKRVESVYKEAVGYRATRIANTEAHKASNFAVAEAYKMAGIKKMEWQARPGACQFCLAMNGTIVTIGQSFVPKGGTIEGTDGGQYLNDYDDIKFADAHPNCRCLLIPIRDND